MERSFAAEGRSLSLGSGETFCHRRTYKGPLGASGGATHRRNDLLYRGGGAGSTLQGREPVFSLTPTPGNVEVVAAPELMEAGWGSAGWLRESGASKVHRRQAPPYAIAERMAMSDGRLNTLRLDATAREFGVAKVHVWHACPCLEAQHGRQ